MYCQILTSWISLFGKKKTLEWKVGANHGYTEIILEIYD